MQVNYQTPLLTFQLFSNANKTDCIDVKKYFSLYGKLDWKPFSFKKCLIDAEAVSKKKQELSKKSVNPTTIRNNLTSFIATKFHSRQEEKPLVHHFIDFTCAESLHLIYENS